MTHENAVKHACNNKDLNHSSKAFEFDDLGSNWQRNAGRVGLIRCFARCLHRLYSNCPTINCAILELDLLSIHLGSRADHSLGSRSLFGSKRRVWPRPLKNATLSYPACSAVLRKSTVWIIGRSQIFPDKIPSFEKSYKYFIQTFSVSLGQIANTVLWKLRGKIFTNFPESFDFIIGNLVTSEDSCGIPP